MWDGCPSEWKIGDGVGFSEEKTIPEDEARSPKDCVDKCSKLRNHKVAANQATVDSRSGSYCHCRFNASGINDRRNRRTCIIKTGKL